jgi:hypothetical protein
MKSRFDLLLLTASLLFASGSYAAPEPSALARLLVAMHQAAGERWDNIESLHIVTKTSGGGKTARKERWEDVRTGRYLVRKQDESGLAQSGFDGISSWHQGRSGIAYALGDVDAALGAANEAFAVCRGWWYPERHGATIALIGERSLEGRSYDVLSVTPEGGRSLEAWIDQSTHLLARTDEQEAEGRVVTTYESYRPVQGVMIAFSVRSGDGVNSSFDEIETVEAVDVNTPVADALYAIPPLPPADIALPDGQDSVDVPFRLTANNRILVPLTLDGRATVDAEFDSGGSLLLQPATVTKLGATASGNFKTGGGGEGLTTSQVGSLRSIALGAAQVISPAFDSFAFYPEQPDLALIGLETLQRFVVRFDFDRMIMTLTRPKAFDYHGTGAIVPFHFQDNQPEVKGSIDGVAGLFAIDTGDNSGLLLIAPFARRYGMVERYHADIPYDGKAVTATRGVWARKRAGTVTLDGADGRPAVQVHDPVTRVSLQHSGFDANRYVSANIGLGILRQFNLTFDYARQRLILEPNHLFGQRDIFNRTGMRLQRTGNLWTVTTIYPDSPAAAAGLKTGDLVEKINGFVPDAIDDDNLAALLKGPEGTKLTLHIRSGSHRRAVELILRDIL